MTLEMRAVESRVQMRRGLKRIQHGEASQRTKLYARLFALRHRAVSDGAVQVTFRPYLRVHLEPDQRQHFLIRRWNYLLVAAHVVLPDIIRDSANKPPYRGLSTDYLWKF